MVCSHWGKSEEKSTSSQAVSISWVGHRVGLKEQGSTGGVRKMDGFEIYTGSGNEFFRR